MRHRCYALCFRLMSLFMFLQCSLVVHADAVSIPFKKGNSDSGEIQLEIMNRVDKIIERISKISTLNLYVSKELKNEVIFVSIKEVKLSELKKFLAQSLNSSWNETERGYELYRTVKDTEQVISADKLHRISMFDKHFKEEKDFLKTNDTPEKQIQVTLDTLRRVKYELENNIRPSSGTYSVFLNAPIDILLKRILIDIGSERLSAIPYFQPITFSDIPNQAQLPLQANIKKYFEDFLVANSLISEKISDPIFADEVVKPWSDNILGKVIKVNDYGKLHLDLMCTPSGLFANITLYSKDGKRINHSGYSIPLRNDEFDNIDFLETKTETLELSKLSAEFLKIAPSGSAISSPISPFALGEIPSKELHDALLDPVEHDPLTFLVYDLVKGLSSEGKYNVIARIDDNYLDEIRSAIRNNRISTDLALKLLTLQHTVEKENNWIIIKPKNDFVCELTRLDRTSLKKFAQNCFNNNNISLKDYSRLYFENGDGISINLIDDIYYAYLYFRLPIKSEYPAFQLPGWLYFLLGSLNDEQWKYLMQGNKLDIARLTQEQKQFVINWAKGGFRALRRVDPSDESIPDILLTGSECLPFGIRANTLFYVDSNHVDALLNVSLVPHGSPDMALNLPQDTSTIARVFAEKRRFGEVSNLDEMLQGTYYVGKKLQITFTIEIYPGIALVANYSGLFTSNNRKISYKDIPQNIKDSIIQTAQSMIIR